MKIPQQNPMYHLLKDPSRNKEVEDVPEVGIERTIETRRGTEENIIPLKAVHDLNQPTAQDTNAEKSAPDQTEEEVDQDPTKDQDNAATNAVNAEEIEITRVNSEETAKRDLIIKNQNSLNKKQRTN
jgi:hypothetical protein